MERQILIFPAEQKSINGYNVKNSWQLIKERNPTM